MCVGVGSPSLRWTPARSRVTEAQFDINPQSFASKPKPFPSSLPFKVSLNGKAAPGFSESASTEEGGSDQLPPLSVSLDDDDDDECQS